MLPERDPIKPGEPEHKDAALRRRRGPRTTPVGVSWASRNRKWRARIWCRRLLRRVSLGLHETVWEAARAIRRYLERER
jgi:hypothetical protein